MRYELRVRDDADTVLRADRPAGLVRLAEEARLKISTEIVIELKFGERTLTSVSTMVFELQR
ncbi:hypothetical protein F7D01_10800 [Erythrobacter sp. 3-20A1M]|uniref:hypothetical protein n=1 Tax=Erythrobacter sp. 3-20A1M TaxID=2653850 RepID=UPI001BFC6CBC|nr:hypothetical protein [Erythrobacter sp. 3-20A1M]QWC57497.1 hypothetical protein F7D01_10800 [Erythrobacter sp. 3-20A1M]